MSDCLMQRAYTLLTIGNVKLTMGTGRLDAVRVTTSAEGDIDTNQIHALAEIAAEIDEFANLYRAD